MGNTESKTEPKYIVWDPKDGEPLRGDDGSFASGGLIGEVGRDNVYVNTYAAYDEMERDLAGLEVGQFSVATFSLGGSKGRYRVYRVR